MGTGPDGGDSPAALAAAIAAHLDHARELSAVLQRKLAPTASDEGRGLAAQLARLEGRLAAVEDDNRELSSRLAEAERQVDKLMNLYVATYQLYASMDPAAVRDAIADITVTLLGAEWYALLLRRDGDGELEVAVAAAELPPDVGYGPGMRYLGGDPVVDAALAEGAVRLRGDEGRGALAVVPLVVQGTMVGALVVLKLLQHKGALRAADRELLDVLAAHAASALLAARAFDTTRRKLQTLEGLVKLVRGG